MDQRARLLRSSLVSLSLSLGTVVVSSCGGREHYEGPPQPTEQTTQQQGAAPTFEYGTTADPSRPPPPLAGGTLLVTRDGRFAVAADPDRDRISLVDLASRSVTHTVALPAGSEPGRAAEDASGRVHVVLRRAGQLARVDLTTGRLETRPAGCAAPRGVAFDPRSNVLRVACVGGELVTLAPEGDGPARVAQLEDDLRDVVFDGARLYVTTFRRATVIEVDAEGAVVSRAQPASAARGGAQGTFSAAVAWRAVAMPGGGLLMAHQRGADRVLPAPENTPEPSTEPAPSSMPSSMPSSAPSASSVPAPMLATSGNVSAPRRSSSPYGGDEPPSSDPEPATPRQPSGPSGGASNPSSPATTAASAQRPSAPRDPCLSRPVVESTVSFARAGGGFEPRARLPLVALPVDVAVDPEGRSVAIVSPGVARFDERAQVLVYPLAQLASGADACTSSGTVMKDPPGMVTSVAYAPNGRLLALTRQPARLHIYNNEPGGADYAVDLGGDDRSDEGFAIFHGVAGPAIACASCHPEGGDDGRVWTFSDVGARRTQSLRGGIRQTAPFHWQGTLRDMGALVADTFVQRMGGRELDELNVRSLDRWIDGIPAVALGAPRDAAAVQRGRALFESASVGCANCHSGARYTNNATVDVGTGGAMQVPSLNGVAARAPYMHTGCAPTLRDRFAPTRCGGVSHGDVSGLSSAQVDDMVAFMRSL